MQSLLVLLTQKINLEKKNIAAILQLLEDGYSIPFIARYRKDMTGGASDEMLRNFEVEYLYCKKLLEKKEDILRLISQRSTLTLKLQQAVENASNLHQLEDIFRPFKENKNSRAAQAIKQGLTPLANMLQHMRCSKQEFEQEAKKFVRKDIMSMQDTINGAKDILAQRYAENPKERAALRHIMLQNGILEIKKAKKFNLNGVFKNFVNSHEKISHLPSYRYLAIMRGVKTQELSVKITIDLQRIENNIKRYKINNSSSPLAKIVLEAYMDGLKRLLLPSIEREVHSELKEKADIQAIEIFGKNLKQLLLTPPLTNMTILGVDPAYISGCKLAVIDKNGNFLDSAIIYPTPPKNEYNKSKEIILNLVKRYAINGVAIGNATGSKETQEFFSKLNEEKDIHLPYTIVSEAGASVYSASKLAQEEYPTLDVTIRGAISIASRLQDPLATLVKIDPKSLGIGQYQHDVDQKLLQKRLHDVTSDLVNFIGVDINSASISLLSYIAGIGIKTAQNIVEYRQVHGNFTTKTQLLEVKGLGKKAYEQAVGFIRIKDSKNIFDNSGIHPESYDIAYKLQKKDLYNIDITSISNELNVGYETLKDIIKELQKPGFDPREELPPIPFNDKMREIEMLKEGDFISGIVRNITDFGAFIDIGLKNDGLLHISKMATTRIKHPLEVLVLNQYLAQIQIISIDFDNGKIGLSLVY